MTPIAWATRMENPHHDNREQKPKRKPKAKHI
jgi:hypothetical protein